MGTNLIKALGQYDCEIVRLGDHLDPDVSEKRAKVVNFSGDIRSPVVWEKALRGVDIVFHLAAQTSETKARADVVSDFAANVVPVINLLEVCKRKRWHPDVFFAGSITEVGIPIRLPFDESHSDNPATIYDLHKLIAEDYLGFYAKQGILRGTTLRLAYVYGPGPKSSTAQRGVLNKMIKMAIGGEELTVWGRGSFLRDYIFVDDVVEAFILAACHISKLNGRHFVIGTGKGYTLSEAFKMVSETAAKKTRKKVKIVHVKPPQDQTSADTSSYVVSSKLFTKLTGWKPKLSLPKGIAATADYFLEN